MYTMYEETKYLRQSDTTLTPNNLWVQNQMRMVLETIEKTKYEYSYTHKYLTMY